MTVYSCELARCATIRKIVKARYDYWTCYNDKTKSTRRMKFMQNGHIYSSAAYAKAERNIKRALREAKITYTKCGFTSHIRGGYGEYVAFTIYMDR